MDDRADQKNQCAGEQRTEAGRQQKAASGADRDDDEHDFEALQQHAFEGRHAGDPVEPRLMPLRGSAELG